MWVAQIISLIAHQLDQYSSLFTGYGNTLLTIGILIIFVGPGNTFRIWILYFLCLQLTLERTGSILKLHSWELLIDQMYVGGRLG